MKRILMTVLAVVSLLVMWNCAGTNASLPTAGADSSTEEDMSMDGDRPDPAQFEGTWTGQLNAGGAELTMVLRSTDNGSWVIDSPDQGAWDIPAELEILEDGSVRFNVPAVKGSYEARLEESDGGEDMLSGSWNQSGMSFPLKMSRGAAPAPDARPQDPVGPLPYSSTDLSFENPEAGISLAGTLTMPEAQGPFPAIVLVSGSGPQDRNEELLNHRPFLVLADYLTRQGIAVLRYDDRGVGESGGDFASATSDDFASDALAAWRFLSSQPGVDPGRTGIAGHSEGGLIGIYLGYRHPEIPFFVLLAPSLLPGDQQLVLQSAKILEASGASEGDIEKAGGINREIYDTALSDLPDSEKQQKLTDKLVGLGISEGDAVQQVQTLMSPWFQFFLSYNPEAEVNSLTMPVLAIFGDKDVQVDAAANSAPITAPNIDVLRFEGLNHLFQHAGTGLPQEYGSIEETMSPDVLKAVADWILSR